MMTDEAPKIYVPPHLRSSPQLSSPNSNTSSRTSLNSSSGYKQNNSFSYNRKPSTHSSMRNSTHSFTQKDPSDPFYSRQDISPRDPYLEEKLYGSQLNSGINFEKYEDIPVEVQGTDPPCAITTFQDCDLDPLLKSNISLAKYTSPTPVQKNAIAIASAAQTGSGKTAAFLIPILSQLVKSGRPNQDMAPPSYSGNDKVRPSCLILAPTRELVIQIHQESKKFAYRSWVRPVCIYGGQPVGDQLRQLSKGCQLLVATPGRLVDLLERGRISLDMIQYLVLDEADRMLDMGFEPDIRKIIERNHMPIKEERTTLMFSATFPRNIQNLARDFLKPYIYLTIGRVGSTSENITQHFMYVEDREKNSELLNLLCKEREEAEGKILLTLIFVETKRSADTICSFLIQNHLPATSIHGDRTQGEREFALKTFKNGKTPILVATAVAARGLDIPNVMHVINYDLPNDVDDYVHRIGRTGRAGNTGKSTAFFNQQHDRQIVTRLVEILKEANQEVPEFLVEKRDFDGGDKGRSFGGGGYRGRGSGNRDYGSSSSSRTYHKAASVPTLFTSTRDEQW